MKYLYFIILNNDHSKNIQMYVINHIGNSKYYSNHY